ncbi:hypothetical protein D3C81_1865870 [compost metagenome]
MLRASPLHHLRSTGYTFAPPGFYEVNVMAYIDYSRSSEIGCKRFIHFEQTSEETILFITRRYPEVEFPRNVIPFSKDSYLNEKPKPIL